MNHDTLTAARERLSAYMLEQLALTENRVGFTFKAQDVAPSTYNDMCVRYVIAKSTGVFPVLEAHSENTIYTAPCINHASRFIHDCEHIRQGLDLSPSSELKLAALTGADVVRTFGVGSLASLLFTADTACQVLHFCDYQEFPQNQLAFAIACIESGKASAMQGALHHDY